MLSGFVYCGASSHGDYTSKAMLMRPQHLFVADLEIQFAVCISKHGLIKHRELQYRRKIDRDRCSSPFKVFLSIQGYKFQKIWRISASLINFLNPGNSHRSHVITRIRSHSKHIDSSSSLWIMSVISSYITKVADQNLQNGWPLCRRK